MRTGEIKNDEFAFNVPISTHKLHVKPHIFRSFLCRSHVWLKCIYQRNCHSPPLNTCCFLITQEVTRLSTVKQPLKCSNLDDIELLRLADARDQVKANQAVIQDSPGHLQSILAQSQLKLAGSVEGHQLTFKLKAILKSRAILVRPSVV